MRALAIPALGIAGAALWWPLRYSLPGPLGATALPPPREVPPAPVARLADFVGAERCAACHAAEYETWRASTHGRAGGAPAADVVIAAFNGRPIRFRDAVVTPRARAGVYEFVIARDGDTAETIRVDGVIGRGHMVGGGTQGFVSRWSDGTLRFVPFDWSRDGGFWFCNTNSRAGRGWQPISEAMRLADCGDWPPTRVVGDAPRWANCQGCHGSQIAVLDSAGRRTTRFVSLAINCESCHGPGRRHVALAESNRLAATADIGLRPLRLLDTEASLRVCYQCHSVKDRLREGYLPGDSLETFYSLRTPAFGDRPLHSDGRVRTFAYQEGHSFSDCYLSGGMTCTSCHDPHSQQYRTVQEVPLLGRFDDAQCTSCHPSKADRLTEHTRHAPGSAGSRCAACHMPFRQHPETADPRTGRAPVRFTRSDHTIAIPDPRADSALGVANACAACHPTRSTAALADRVTAWWGTLKPASARRAARSPGAVFDSVARLLDTAGTPSGRGRLESRREWLEGLLRDPDVDIRAAAAATLHLWDGGPSPSARLVARAAAREGRHDYALRARWALLLGAVGDRATEAGDWTRAFAAYARAAAVAPRDARLFLAIGNARRAAGDLGGAIAAYRESVQLDPAATLAMVNLGITLAAGGDSLGGEAMLRRATTVDPAEPLAWFNLGNAVLLRGDLAAADSMLQRALALDGTLHGAEFQRARIALLRDDRRAALRHLLRGLAMDSSNAAARELAARLRHTER